MKCKSPIVIKGITVPCGRCVWCRLQYSAMWALRCVLESQCHKENVFLTLTFNDEHLPKDKSVSKHYIQKFLKRFRKSVSPAKVRYFLSGEYGDSYKRCHYHALIFGIGIRNPVFTDLHWDMKHQGFWCECKAWRDDNGKSIGHCFIGSVTFASAQYVAKYVMKKRKGKDSDAYYEKLGVAPEFCLTSRRPALGYQYFKKHFNTIWNKGYINLQGKRLPLPRYFMEKFKYNPRVMFYKHFQYSAMEKKYWDEFAHLCVRFGDKKARQYMWDSLQQSALNLEKRLELSKGALNA